MHKPKKIYINYSDVEKNRKKLLPKGFFRITI